MRIPILTYKNKKFYDLDEIPFYIETINDLSDCKKFRQFIRCQINENAELYEMAKSWSDFIQLCSAKVVPTHYTIANIICLEDTCPEIVNHWKNEILAFTDIIITGTLSKGVKHAKIVIGQLISEYADLYKGGYSYLDSLLYEDATLDEINKANRQTSTDAQRKTARFIKSRILPNIDEYVEPNKERVYKLFNGLISACNKSGISIFKDALDDFILNEH